MTAPPARGRRRPPAAPSGLAATASLFRARVGVERVDRQFVLVALAQQHPERAVTVTPLPRRVGKPAAQQLERACQLAAVAVVDRPTSGVGGECPLGELSIDSARGQAAADPLRTPSLELALVGDEQLREPLVVEQVLLDQRLDRGVGVRLRNALALQLRADLGDGSLTPVDVRARQIERLLQRPFTCREFRAGERRRRAGPSSQCFAREVDPADRGITVLRVDL